MIFERLATVEFTSEAPGRRYEVQDVSCFGSTLSEAERDAVRAAERHIRDQGHHEPLHLVWVTSRPV